MFFVRLGHCKINFKLDRDNVGIIRKNSMSPMDVNRVAGQAVSGRLGKSHNLKLIMIGLLQVY